MKAEISDILHRTKAIIQIGWTQNSFARSADGGHIPYDHPSATCWCLAGALSKAQEDGNYAKDSAMYIGMIFSRSLNNTNFIKWNDDPERTVQEVVALIDKVIIEQE